LEVLNEPDGERGAVGRLRHSFSASRRVRGEVVTDPAMSRPPFLSNRVLPMPEGAVLPRFHVPWCFGCGPDNKDGLMLQARLEGDRVVADLHLASHFEGGPGVAHGGALAAFLDDLMGFVPVAHAAPAVTARLEVEFRRPVLLEATLRAEAWLCDRDGRKMWAEGIARDAEGHVFVESRALYLTVGLEHFAAAVAGMSEEGRERLTHFRPGEYYP
jgi:acyl-coenzyme A thioesterase PaaI-like protein